MVKVMDSSISDNVWHGSLSKPITKNHKISLCITCMNRLYEVKFTLLKNIEDNLDYPDAEFVLLDYNSRDGLEDWVKLNAIEYIENGKLTFLRTDEPKYYSLAHSKNVAFLAASGDIVHNLDTDNLTGRNFCSYLNILANQVPSHAFFTRSARPGTRLWGKIGFYKDEFIRLLGGYDEDFSDYSPDDRDIWWRAVSIPLTVLWYNRNLLNREYFSRRLWEIKHVIDAGYEHPNHYENYSTNDERVLRRHYHKMQRRIRRKIAAGLLKANTGRKWGNARLIKNFGEELITGVDVDD